MQLLKGPWVCGMLAKLNGIIRGGWDAGENPPLRATSLQVVIQLIFLEHEPCASTLLRALGPPGPMERARLSQYLPTWGVKCK